LKNKEGPKGAGRGSSVGAGKVRSARAGRQAGSKQAGSGTQTGRREKDSEQETTNGPPTRERLTQYIGGKHRCTTSDSNETRVAEGRCRKLNN